MARCRGKLLGTFWRESSVAGNRGVAPGQQQIAGDILKKRSIEGSGFLESQRRYQPRLGPPWRRSLRHYGYAARPGVALSFACAGSSAFD